MQDFTIGWDLDTYNSIFGLINMIVFAALIAASFVLYVFHSLRTFDLKKELKQTYCDRLKYEEAIAVCVKRYRDLHDGIFGHTALDQKETELISRLIDPLSVWKDASEEYGTAGIKAFQFKDQYVVLICYSRGKPDSMRMVERLSNTEASVVFSKHFKLEAPCLLFKTLNEKFKLCESPA